LLITMFDDEALKAQRIMTEVHQAMVTARNECLSSIRALLHEDQKGRDVEEELSYPDFRPNLNTHHMCV
jgi:hypothetical protein